MSFEINPVLAGKFDTPDYATANNISTSSANDVTAPDDRRYTKFDRTITEAGTATLSFGDFVDMFNPLQHIPVVSSVYRAIVGEDINPVSRVAGDIIYGGLLGGASAVLGGLSAVADAGLEAQTGKDSSGLVMAALFGSGDDEKANPVQVADTGNIASPPVTANATAAPKKIELAQAASANPLMAALEVQAPSVSQSLAENSVAPQTTIPDAGAAPQVAAPRTIPDASSTGAIQLSSTKAGKQPFGGVMSPPSKDPIGAIQAEDMAMALSASSPGMRMGHTIYTNRLAANGTRSLPPMLSATGMPRTGKDAPVFSAPPVAPPAAIGAPDNTPKASGADIAASVSGLQGHRNPLPPELVQDMMMKAISQYKNAPALGAAAPGSTINLTN